MKTQELNRLLLLELLKEKHICRKELMRRLIDDHFLIKQDSITKYLNGQKALDEPFIEAVLKVVAKVPTPNANKLVGPLDVVKKLNEVIKKHGITNAMLVKKLERFGFSLSPDSLSKCRRGERRLEAQLFLAILSVLGENTLADVANAKVIPVAVISRVNCGNTNCKLIENDYTYIRDSEYKLSLRAYRACGEAMAPEIEEDDGIIVDEHIKPSHGDLVVYELDGEKSCKVYIKHPKNEYIELRPLMPTPSFRSLKIHFNDDEMESVKMLKVVRVIKRKLLCSKKRLLRLGLA